MKTRVICYKRAPAHASVQRLQRQPQRAHRHRRCQQHLPPPDRVKQSGRRGRSGWHSMREVYELAWVWKRTQQRASTTPLTLTQPIPRVSSSAAHGASKCCENVHCRTRPSSRHRCGFGRMPAEACWNGPGRRGPSRARRRAPTPTAPPSPAPNRTLRARYRVEDEARCAHHPAVEVLGQQHSAVGYMYLLLTL